MLVHICCSVDSHYFLSELQKAYPEEKLVGYFYNPNIHPKAEHDLRLSDVRRSCDMLGIRLIEGDYELEKWLGCVKGQEHEPEKGARCSTCFDVRLEKSAQIAKELGEKTFTTTLLSSPMKEQEILYQQGDFIAQKQNLDFIKINVRKNGGVQKQNELAKKDNLYRQNYCGCQFTLSQQRTKQDKCSLEMLGELGGRALPGSIEERQGVFAKRDALESKDKRYILTQRKRQIYRLLQGRLYDNQQSFHSYIFTYSESKKLKIGTITWATISLQSLLDSNAIDSAMINITSLPESLRLGFCKKDDTIFLCLNDLNALAQTHYVSTQELMYQPISYGTELFLRTLLCGYGSINPVIVVDKEYDENLSLEIRAVFQEERLFHTIGIV